MTPVAARSVVLCACLALGACAGLPARGIVGGQTIDSRVDSEAARYYLENYLAGKRGNAALDERIDRAYRSFNGALPDRGELKRLSDDFSLDFAALYFADRIARIPVNRRFRAGFDQARSDARKAFPEGRVRLPAAARDFEVVFVPGYLYKRLPILGTNFAAPRAALKKVGLANTFVETKEDGAVEANADLVAAAIRARAQTGRRLILISASKSGSEVALALTKLAPAESRHVAAWINAVGALQGSPLADGRVLPEVEEKTGEIDGAGVESLTTERSRKRFATFHIPEDVLVVNYIGVPVTGSVSSLGGLGFSYMKKFGPSDGITLLPDAIFPGGVTLVALGRDHFLLDKQIDVTTVALTMTVIRWLEENGGTISQRPGS
jgi:hypothetical protein